MDWGGASEGYVESEFQIYPFLIAILYRFFGIHDWLGRSVSLLFFLFSAYLLFKLTEKIFDHTTAICAGIFFAISPLNIHFSRAFMPTSMLVCCSIASIYYFSEWVDREHWRFFLASCITTALAILVKLPSLYLGLPLLYIALRKYGIAAFLEWHLWLFAAFVLLPSIAWYYHAHQLFLETHLTFGISDGGYSKFGNLTYWLNPGFYKIIASRILNDILTLPGLVFATIGLFLSVQKENHVMFWWGLAFGIYILIAAEGHQTHYYYQMPLVPILCVYAGRGMSYLWQKDLFKGSFLKNRLSSKTVVIILFLLISLTGVLKAQNYLNFDPERLAFGRRIEQLTEKDSLIIIGGWNKGKHLQVKHPPRDPIDFYFSHRKGWEVDLDDWSLSLVVLLKQQGAHYFATFWPMGLDRKRVFAEGMRDEYRLLEATRRWVIYALTK